MTNKTQFKDMKFVVKSQEHSAAIQKVLFKMGYNWVYGGNDVENKDKPYLCANRHGYVSWEDTFYSYCRRGYPEYTLEDLLLEDLGESVQEEAIPLEQCINIPELQAVLAKANCYLTIQYNGVWVYDNDSESEVKVGVTVDAVAHINKLLEAKINYLEMFKGE